MDPQVQAQARSKAAENLAAVEARQTAIRDAARAKVADLLRSERGIEAPRVVEAPVSQVAEHPRVQETAPVVDQAAFLESVQAQTRAAEAAKAEAAQLRAEADAKLAKLQASLKNPIQFLQEQNMDLDTWNARLLNGGEPTMEERLKAESAKEVEAVRSEVQALKTQLAQKEHAELRVAAAAELRPGLEKEFPLLNANLGVEKALDWLQSEAAQARKLGVQFDSRAALAAYENHLLSIASTALAIPAIQSKLSNSVTKPQAGNVDNGPRTITNRLVSSTSPVRTGPTTLEEKRARARELIAAMSKA